MIMGNNNYEPMQLAKKLFLMALVFSCSNNNENAPAFKHLLRYTFQNPFASKFIM